MTTATISTDTIELLQSPTQMRVFTELETAIEGLHIQLSKVDSTDDATTALAIRTRIREAEFVKDLFKQVWQKH